MTDNRKPYITLTHVMHGERQEIGATIYLSDEEAKRFSAEDIRALDAAPATAGATDEGEPSEEQAEGGRPAKKRKAAK